MKKIAKFFKALYYLFRHPYLGNNLLHDNRIWTGKLSPLPVVDLAEIIKTPAVDIDHFMFLDGGSMITDLALLKGLSRQIPGCSYFEIGTWRGESVVNVAAEASTCFTLNLSPAEMRARKISERIIEQVGILIKDQANITCLNGDSRNFDYQALGKKFDLIFIDGDHTYPYVKSDTEQVFRHLVHEDSIVIWHDYGFSPEEVRYEVLAGILAGIPPGEHQNLVHVANTKCAIWGKKKWTAQAAAFPQIANKKFSVTLRISPSS